MRRSQLMLQWYICNTPKPQNPMRCLYTCIFVFIMRKYIYKLYRKPKFLQLYAETEPNSQMREKMIIFDDFAHRRRLISLGSATPACQLCSASLPGAWRMAHGHSRVLHPGRGVFPGPNRRPRQDFRLVSGPNAAVVAENAARGTKCVRIADTGPRPAIFGCQ